MNGELVNTEISTPVTGDYHNRVYFLPSLPGSHQRWDPRLAGCSAITVQLLSCPWYAFPGEQRRLNTPGLYFRALLS